ncbi:glycoside hydrolase family 28 protein [Carboxylicivirga linearis]|uniref:Glycoside hydrolase family 28 protein n=1 Tax=Carboxylicivirga linearis TaxID=1628157 RepID=A0ABS5JXP0_9BACT|nr:glycoside hydrolase family 28 protein [Carboxylicivirga linearis]MBS2099690.1 glycoside hydrolase family 28 protein [Carboxylicivirga linearis]
MKSYKLLLRIQYLLLATGLLAVSITGCCNAEENNEVCKELDIYGNLEFEMPRVKEATFPDYSVSILDFGAVSDGYTDNSKAFFDAIYAVAGKGGGKVIVPRGIFVTGPIVLKSNINLHVEEGAVIRFSRNFDDYPLVETSFEGLNTYRCMSPVYAKDVENIAFTGGGTFDGNGDAWRPVKRSKMTANQWNGLLKSGGVLSDDGSIWYPSAKSKAGDSRDNFNVTKFDTKEEYEAVRDFLRPVLVSVVNCKKVLFDGPTFQNSPAWNLHPLMSEDVIIRNLNVRNPWYSQNGDGLDLESCKNVLIYNNSFDVGDDAICIKSGKDKDGRDRGIPTQNVIIKNNVVYHGHGGFVVGSEMSGGVKNIHVSDCVFMGTDIGLRFKSTRGRGGVVENVYISNIDMIDIPAEPIRFNLFYGGMSPIPDDENKKVKKEDQPEIVPVSEETPSFKNVFMENITANGFGNAAFFMGLPEMNLKNVHLKNAVLRGNKGIAIVDAEGMLFENVKVVAEQGASLSIYNGKSIDINGFEFTKSDVEAISIMGTLTSEISINKKVGMEVKSVTKVDDTVNKDQLILR